MIVTEIETQPELVNPVTGEEIGDDADSLIAAFKEASEMASKWYAFKHELQNRIAAMSDGDTKTRRVRGQELRAKVEMPDDAWDQSVLKEAYNSFPKFRDKVLRIGTVTVLKREYGKIVNESGPADFEQFKKMLVAANRGPQGTPRITVEG